ncbi:hypothetical protein M902_0391 [Bacteriovorax sp. BAL6_X]|uniref:hypothetical protein n=1 Tax=Bacteriovorax sp. BAL6_X TaxID=1201290 RepID=UPI00038579BE|nr:hypothetical protein [Bacteriovorax sp. BAL6_X]EPZ49532.1 hypothetical protein M902_0391 [Bacteriovorax sp. BAL6_X]
MKEISVVKNSYKVVTKVFNKIQEIRFNKFIDGCRKSLESEGILDPSQEVEFLSWFETEFSKNKLFDYVKKSIESTSDITRLALSRLFTLNNSKLFNSSPYSESVLLRGLGDVDDLEVEMFLMIFLVSLKDTSEHSLNMDDLNNLKMNGDDSVRMYISKEVFNLESNPYFKKFGKDPFSMSVFVIDSFISKGFLKSSNVLGNYSSGVGFQLTTISLLLIENLAWANYVLNPTSDLAREYIRNTDLFKSKMM